MVIEKKMSAPKYYSANTAQLQEVKSLTRWQCEVNVVKRFKVIIFVSDLQSGVGHERISYSA